MRLFSKIYFLIVFVILLFTSCSKDSKFEVVFDGDYYADVNEIYTLKKDYLRNLYSFFAQGDYPKAAFLVGDVAHDVKVNKIEYQTTLNEETLVESGLLSYPSTPGDYPILCFQNGTNVLHSKAPTEDSSGELFLLLESIASMGFIVVIPDYPGFGSSYYKPHPYLIKEETVQSAEDIILATNEYLEKVVGDTKSNNQLFLMGYSQGAWATLQLQSKIEANEVLGAFELMASSCGAGPYSISNLFIGMLSGDEISNPYFLAYMMNAYNEYNLLDTLELNDIFNDPYASRIPELFNGGNTSSAINDSLSTSIPELLNPTFIDAIRNLDNPAYAPILNAFINNNVHEWTIEIPTWLFHGSADQVVPYEVTTNMYDNFLMAGSSASKLKVVSSELEGLGHIESIVPFGLSTIENFLVVKNQ